MTNQNRANSIDKLQKTQTRQMLEKIEDKQQQQKTLNKLDELLEINLKHQAQRAEKAGDIKQTEKLNDALKELHQAQQSSETKNKYASSVKFGNPNSDLYSKALEETQKMIKLSQEAQVNKVSDAKLTSDALQLNKKDPTKNVETKSVIDNQAAISQQIAEDNKYQFKAIRIAEDMAIKGNMPDNQEKQAKSDLKKDPVQKSQTPNSNMEVSVHIGDAGDQNQESKGKAFIEEEIKEKIKEGNSKPLKVKTTVNEEKSENPKDTIVISEEAEKTRKTGKNKLRAKFNKHKK